MMDVVGGGRRGRVKKKKETVRKMKGKKLSLVTSQKGKNAQPSAPSSVKQEAAPSYLPTITVFYVKITLKLLLGSFCL